LGSAMGRAFVRCFCSFSSGPCILSVMRTVKRQS
jgi:hypothetical protein